MKQATHSYGTLIDRQQNCLRSKDKDTGLVRHSEYITGLFPLFNDTELVKRGV